MLATLRLNDVIINYEFIESYKENAETLLLAHGNGFDLTIWDESVELLRKNFHILRYDFRGQGSSIRLRDEQFTWYELISDLESLLSYLSLENVHLVGYSLGGNFAIELAKHQKPYLKSMTLISTPIYAPKPITDNEINRRNLWTDDEFRKNIKDLVVNLCYPVEEQKTERILKMYNKVDYQTYLTYFNLCAESIVGYNFEEFKSLDIPTLFLAGEFDPLYPPRLQVMYYHYFENSRFFIVPQASNTLMVDQPKQFVEYLTLFVNSLENSVETNHYNYSKLLHEELDVIFKNQLQSIDKPIKLKLIGDFELIMNGNKVEGKWNQRKSMEVITYIICNKKVKREELIELFWPNDLQKGRNQLSVTLNHIKKMIEASTKKSIKDFFLIDRDNIALIDEPSVDILRLQESIEYLKTENNLEKKLSQSLKLFQDLPESINGFIYEDWFVRKVGEIENQILDICEELLNQVSDNKHRLELLKIIVKHHSTEEEYYEELFKHLNKLQGREYLYYKKKYNFK
ncbi:alpha/beta fold hydrolase [Alkalibacillus silvisoli]|uniref:AB hydrolase-1 domain-containing protein n=1 Tax=Alkalibacillus silvisoli TaxID=392823 RepID=A0ABP3K2H2_9BACI